MSLCSEHFWMSLLSLLKMRVIRDSSDKHCFVPEDKNHHHYPAAFSALPLLVEQNEYPVISFAFWLQTRRLCCTLWSSPFCWGVCVCVVHELIHIKIFISSLYSLPLHRFVGRLVIIELWSLPLCSPFGSKLRVQGYCLVALCHLEHHEMDFGPWRSMINFGDKVLWTCELNAQLVLCHTKWYGRRGASALLGNRSSWGATVLLRVTPQKTQTVAFQGSRLLSLLISSSKADYVGFVST